jgi:hypothetical protein
MSATRSGLPQGTARKVYDSWRSYRPNVDLEEEHHHGEGEEGRGEEWWRQTTSAHWTDESVESGEREFGCVNWLKARITSQCCWVNDKCGTLSAGDSRAAAAGGGARCVLAEASGMTGRTSWKAYFSNMSSHQTVNNWSNARVRTTRCEDLHWLGRTWKM